MSHNIDDVGFSDRTCSVLKYYVRIETLEELSNLTKEKLLTYAGLGPAMLYEIINVLKDYNLSLYDPKIKLNKTVYVIIGFNIKNINKGTATATALTIEGTYEKLDINNINRFRLFDTRLECDELINKCFSRCISYGITI